MLRPLTALLLAAFVGAGCAPRTAPPATQPTPVVARPDAMAELQAALDGLFDAEDVRHAYWAMKVASLATDEPVYSRNASRLMLPASAQKLLTAAVAAERLGWDYRFTTRLYTTGSVDAEGILMGDLIVISNGDPTINPRHADRWRVFDDWAATLRGRGIRIVRGHLVGDDSAFAGPGWGRGWAWDDLQYGYGAPVGALQYHENQVEVLVGPGMEPGARAVISLSPPGSGMFVDHGVVTVEASAESRLEIARVPGTPFLRVTGAVAAEAKPIVLNAAVENPTMLYLNALREALGRHGIYVSGDAIDIDDVRGPPPDLGRATLLIEDRSPPLDEIIDVTLKWSRNGYAETLLHALATPNGPATAAAGLEVLRETLGSWTVPDESYLVRDGSGLSRHNLMTANASVALLRHLWRDSRHAERFRSTLPVAGLSGTLANRLNGTPAEGRVWAKTGSMSHVRALSGYLLTAAGEPLVFAILVNNYQVPNAHAEAVVDEAMVRLVAFRR